MIVFDLACGDGGHIFEGWFGSTEDYEDQKSRGFLTCPICGSADVTKAVMAPRVGAKGNQQSQDQQSQHEQSRGQQSGSTPVALPQDDPAKLRQMMKALAKAQARALEGSEYVGPRFAEEARSMHLGETDHRSIHGQASVEEAKSLIEDGIGVVPLPLPVRPPGTDN